MGRTRSALQEYCHGSCEELPSHGAQMELAKELQPPSEPSSLFPGTVHLCRHLDNRAL